jgi:hypothetical protein
MKKYHKDIEINQNVVDEIFKANLYHHEFNNDIIHIQYALKSKFNISLTVPETILFWEWKSTAYCASWLMLSSDNDIVESFQKFVNYSYYSKKEKTMVKKLPVTKKKTMKKKKEKEWVQIIENEDGSTSAVFDLDSEKEDMIKRLYNVEVITEDIMQKFLRDALNNLENNYQENLEWPEWKPNDEKQTPEVKKVSPKKKTISKKKKTVTK